VITPEDAGGLKLEWGDPEVVEALVHQTAEQTGLGRWISRGARALAERFGDADAAVQVNGLEVAYHDPRAGSGMAISYATSPRGACHNQSDYFMVDLLGQAEDALGIEKFDRHAGAEKIESVIRHQDWRTVCNSLVLCFFANVPPDDVLALVNAANGSALTLDDLMEAGERGWNLKRLINGRYGIRAENDRLPPALLRAYQEGGAAEFVIPFREMLFAYYQRRGWDTRDGLPTSETRERLNLTWAG
jgi:aldehyde:ferredoxin oxidoreductase